MRTDRRALLLVLIAVMVIGCTPPLINPGPARFFALRLPATTPPADADGTPLAGISLSVRLLLDDKPFAHSHTVVGDMDPGRELQPGHSLGMSFVAPRSFVGVAASLQRIGPGPTSVRLTLRRNNRQGRQVATQVLNNLPQQGWVELRTHQESAGRYYLQISEVTGKGIIWRGSQLLPQQDDIWAGYNERNIPFDLPATLAGIPDYDGSSLSILVNTQAERIYILGGRSSYDHGIGHWGDYEARNDASDRQFIGDRTGELEVIYTDGSRDTVPIIPGLNQWWWQHWGDTATGGPFLEPFATTPRPMIASLHIYSLGDSPLAPSFWVYRPQAKTIARLRLVDNPMIQGYPLVAAITLEAQHGGPNAKLLPSPTQEEGFATWLKDHTITSSMVAGRAYESAVANLRDFLYTSLADIPTTIQPESLPDRRGPVIRFSGSAAATILSNVYEHGLKDMLAKLDANGTFHSSTYNSPSFGGYGGIGTWRGGVGYFYNQAWSRDMGRVLLEMIRLGFLDEVDAGLAFAAAHLYDLPNAYPRLARQGQRVPAHWGTVLGLAGVFDIDQMGDDNQENDGHGLLLLAFVRAWQARGRDAAWLDRNWSVVRDAAEWFCFQLENPAFSRATSVLYTEGEAANGGGYDVYSNMIAAEALQGSAEMARARGDNPTAARWQGCAATIRQGMRRELTDRDARYGTTWRAVAWSWSYGHESLAPAFISVDRAGYTLAADDSLAVTRQTYRRQIELLSGFRSGRTLGYGQAFISQAALLLDDMVGLGEALDNMARFIFDADAGPYLVPEGIALHPSGAYWYRVGDLGNAVQEAEVIKTLTLLAGLDDLSGSRLAVVPRLPFAWTGISVSDYPVTVDGQRITLAYTLGRVPRRLTLNLSADLAVPTMDVRLGPFPLEASLRLTVDGTAVAAPVMVESGGWGWVWLRDLRNRQRLTVEASW